jgi:hypothetical protein
MAAKRPTGERPKQLSTLAKTVKSAARGGVASKSGKVEVLTPSQAAARAGKMRDKAAAKKTTATKKVTIKGLKQTNADKNFRGETNTTADTARKGNIARVADRAAAKNKASLMKTSARSHQKDLADLSGLLQGRNKGKGKIGLPGSPSYNTAVKAIARTKKSFK